MKYYLGIDVGGTNIKVLLCDLAFQPLVSRSIKTHNQLSFEEIMGNIFALADEMLAEAGADKADLKSVGIGLPGLVDSAAKTVIKLGSLAWNGRPVGAVMEEHFGVPVLVDNDGNINILGERYFGAGQGCDDLILITLGTGVGGSVISGGHLIRGASNLAGEVGHLTLEVNGEACRCGRVGCFQCYCRAQAIVLYGQKMMEQHPDSLLWELCGGEAQNLAPEMIDAGIDAGDTASIATIQRTAKYLAAALSSLMVLYNPAVILLGGGISNAGERLLGPTRNLIQNSLQHPLQMCEIRQAQLGSRAGMFGACILADAAYNKNELIL